jgi:AraC-like DNA-binding protein/mannose-6-phosphate isomerase-like protein (cupin superfamily)
VLANAPLFQPFPMQAQRRAQVWRHQPMYRRPRHFHDEPEINLVLRGAARLGVGDRELTLTSGQAVVLHPGQDHELLSATDDLELYVLAVRPELAARDVAVFGAAGGLAHVAEGKLATVGELLHTWDQVSSEEALEAGLAGVWSSVVRSAELPPAVARRARAALHADPGVAGAELASRLSTTPSELSRAFRRSFGTPLVEYRARVRLLRFVQLVDSGQSLTSAALSADFGSYAQCFRVFERALGCSPSEYFSGARRELDQRLA